MERGVRDFQHDEEKFPISRIQDSVNCPVCELCGTFEGLKICAACKDVWYCCKDHQRTHWSQHKTACKSSQNNSRGPNPNITAGRGGASLGGVPLAQADSPPQQETVTNTASGIADSLTLSALQAARAQRAVHAGGHVPNTDTIVPTSCREEEGVTLTAGRGSADKRKAGSPPNHSPAAAETAAGRWCSCTQSCSCTADITGADSTTNPGSSGDMTQCKTLCAAEGIAKVPSQASREKPISKSARRRVRKTSLASCSSSGSLSGSSLASSHSSSGSMASGSSSGSFGSSHPSSGSLISQNTSSTSLRSSSSSSSLVTFDLGPQPGTPTNTETMPEPTNATKDLADYVVKYLTEYGICVIDKFLGEKQGNRVWEEVVGLHQKGIFQEGQLVAPQGPKQKVRGDQITWVERGEPDKEQITFLVSRLDSLMMACNERFRRNEVGGRTKAMVACYPGNGSYYLRHVDNPNEDGRLITCIYYLNKDWNAKRDGGVLRIFPESIKNTWVADIEPQFDRLLFFWSDRRNPHEVQAAYKQRFAITVWYFDKAERQQALSRYQSGDSKPGNARTMSTTLVSAISGQE